MKNNAERPFGRNQIPGGETAESTEIHITIQWTVNAKCLKRAFEVPRHCSLFGNRFPYQNYLTAITLRNPDLLRMDGTQTKLGFYIYHQHKAL